MSGGFVFGTPTPQQQPTAPLFGTPLASSTPAFGGTTGTAAPSLFGTNPTSTAGSFSFSNPAPGTSQPQPQTGFNLGGLATSTATSVGSGFSFGTTNVPASASTTTSAQPSSTPFAVTTTGTTSFGGLGGIPSSAGPRLSTLALGSDPGTGWSTRNENRAVQELPVPPEIIMAVEELKTQMKNHKAMMVEVNRTFDLDIDSVAEQIEEVRMGFTTLVNLMHKQELQSASLIKDMQELSKDMDLLAQARDGYGGITSSSHNFLFELMDKYASRMLKYKVEIERAEFALQTIVGAYNVNAKDLWSSLTAVKDTVILLAAQIQQVHEEMRNDLIVHKNISQLLYGASPKPWISSAIAGNLEVSQSAPPLERVLSTPSKAASSTTNLETEYQRTYTMLNRVPSLTDSRSLLVPQTEALRNPNFDIRSSSNLGLSASFHHPSVMGSYLGPSSTTTTASLKRSKK